MWLYGFNNQVLLQLDLLQSKEALAEAEIPPHVEMQYENHPNMIFYYEWVYTLGIDQWIKCLFKRGIQPFK